MLVLMLRKHITWLRSKGGSILLPLDHHIDIHKTIGIIIMIETALHIAAHLAYLGLFCLLNNIYNLFSCFSVCVSYLFIII